MNDFKLGVLLWSQASTWPEFERAAKEVDDLGYEHLWTWDHLHAIFGEPQQPIFEGWMSLGAWAKATSRVRLGLLVGANTFRNPGLVAKMATTLDHISDGRAIMGLGGLGSTTSTSATASTLAAGFGQRLDWMDEAVAAIRMLLDGGEVTSPAGGHYQFDGLRQEPLPLQQHLPIMIGGSASARRCARSPSTPTCGTAWAQPETMEHKMEVLMKHCHDVNRDPNTIVKTTALKPVIRNSVAEAEKVMRAQMAHNQTPLSTSRTTSLSSADRASSSLNT